MLLRNHFIKLGGIVFQGMFFDILYFDFYNSLTERNLDNVSDFYVVRSLGVLAVYFYMLGITSIIGNGSSFNNSGDFQKFV